MVVSEPEMANLAEIYVRSPTSRTGSHALSLLPSRIARTASTRLRIDGDGSAPPPAVASLNPEAVA